MPNRLITLLNFADQDKYRIYILFFSIDFFTYQVYQYTSHLLFPRHPTMNPPVDNEQLQYANLIQMLEAEVAGITQKLETIRQNANDTQSLAPDASEEALDYVEEAEDKREEVFEKLDDAKEKLYNFKEKANFAAQQYDLAQSAPHLEKEARNAQNAAERARDSLNSAIEKARNSLEKLKIATEKAESRFNIARIRAQTQEEKEREKMVRINFTLPNDMKTSWKDLADDLGISISELVRKSVDTFEASMKKPGKFIDKIEAFGTEMDKMGRDIEQAYYNKYEKPPSPPPAAKPFPTATPFTVPTPTGIQKTSEFSSEEKERIKNRVKGLIKLQKSIPIDKLAQIFNKPPEYAENIIYELVAESVEGDLHEGVFKFKGNDEIVIEKLYNLIDRL